MSRPTTAVADATIIVVIADTVDASCHDSHDNVMKQMIMTQMRKQYGIYDDTLMNIDYIIMRTTTKYDAAIIKYVMLIIIALLYEQISN